jgi:hypothetical protein
MINIYTDRSKVPSNLEYVHDSELFFTLHGIQDTQADREIIKEIDQAKYRNRQSFIDRFDVTIPIGCLSTSSKTLINAVNYPDKIFNAIGLGENAYKYMLHCLDNCNLLFDGGIQYYVPDDIDDPEDLDKIQLNGNPITSIYDLEQ